MTSRDRVLAALDHREPDRVPLDLDGTFVTGIAATSLDRLRRHLGLEHRPVKVYDAYQMLGQVEIDLAERFGLDCLPVNPPAMTLGLRTDNYKPWTLMDGTQVLVPEQFDIDVTDQGDWLIYAGGDRSRPPCSRMPKDGFYFDTIGYGDWHPDWEPPPIQTMRTAAKSWHIAENDLSWLADHAGRLRRSTDKALVLGAWPYMGLHYVGSLTDWWTLLAGNPGYVKDLFALSTEIALENLPKLWAALGENIDVIATTGLDFGTQRSEWCAPEVFREIYIPGLRDQFSWIRQNTTWKVFEHSCGSIANIIVDLVDAGLDALNPVQTSAAGMEPAGLKQRFGDRLSFWGGGVETQSTLPFGTPEQVREEVIQRIRTFAPGGGFIFNPVHNIQPNTPPENIQAAYDTAREFGTYPIADS